MQSLTTTTSPQNFQPHYVRFPQFEPNKVFVFLETTDDAFENKVQKFANTMWSQNTDIGSRLRCEEHYYETVDIHYADIYEIANQTTQ